MTDTGNHPKRPMRSRNSGTTRRLLISALLIVVIGGLGLIAFSWRPAIGPIAPPDPRSFEPAQVEQGRVLAAIGDCSSCHTAPAGKPFGGGLRLGTPFGGVSVPNITPDPEAGIGRWSEAAFRRAMREGVGRDGEQLYPAFPYDHFTLVNDDDIAAIYAFLMTRAPVPERVAETQLAFPLNIRAVIAAWKILFFDERRFESDLTKDALWNRGAYLVEGLAHCGGCHTPRNRFGAEIAEKRYAGAEVDGWDAYAIDADSTAPVPWNVEGLTQYLRQGFAENHGVAAGAMASVVSNLQDVPDADIRAIATYVASLIGSPSSQSLARGVALVAETATTGNGLAPASAGLQIAPPAVPDESGVGAAIYAAVCSTCHESRRPLPFGGIDLHLSSALSGLSPRNAINLVMFGIPAADGVPATMMPGFAGSFTDAQISDLVTYLRSRFGSGPAWGNVPALVKATRERSPLGDAPHKRNPQATKRLTSGDGAS